MKHGEGGTIPHDITISGHGGLVCRWNGPQEVLGDNNGPSVSYFFQLTSRRACRPGQPSRAFPPKRVSAVSRAVLTMAMAVHPNQRILSGQDRSLVRGSAWCVPGGVSKRFGSGAGGSLTSWPSFVSTTSWLQPRHQRALAVSSAPRVRFLVSLSLHDAFFLCLILGYSATNQPREVLE